MAGKADFSAQEWESLQQGVTGAGLLVSLSDRSFFDTFKEAGALGKHIARAKQSNPSQLVRELADIYGTGFGLTSSPDAVETETLAALRGAKRALASKAPDELEFVPTVRRRARTVGGRRSRRRENRRERRNRKDQLGASISTPASPAARGPLLLLASDQSRYRSCRLTARRRGS